MRTMNRAVLRIYSCTRLSAFVLFEYALERILIPLLHRYQRKELQRNGDMC